MIRETKNSICRAKNTEPFCSEELLSIDQKVRAPLIGLVVKTRYGILLCEKRTSLHKFKNANRCSSSSSNHTELKVMNKQE